MRERPRSCGHVEDVFWTHTDTSAGSSDTVLNELTAIPEGWSPEEQRAEGDHPAGEAREGFSQHHRIDRC